MGATMLKKQIIKYNIPTVQTMEFNQSCRDSEGVVLRTNQGHMIKMKADHYVRLHKAKDKISVEKNAVDAIINNEIDDLLPNLSQEDQDRVNNLSDALHSFLLERSSVLEESVRNDVQTWKDKKSYALDCSWPQYEKAATFKLWDNPAGAYDYLMDQLVKSLGKEVNYNSFKQTWGFDYAY